MATTAAATAPAIAGRAQRRAIPAAATVATLNAALAAVQLLAPAQPADGHHFARPSDYVIEVLFAASLLGAAYAVVLLGRSHRQLGRWGSFGTIAAATAARGQETLDVIQFPGIVIWLIAGLLMAIATVRARVLPIVICLGFAVGLPATMALGHAGTLVLAAVWAAAAVALAAGRTRVSNQK